MYPTEYVPHGRWPSPVPTNDQRYREWLVKMAARAVNYGNGYFQFRPIFDPPETDERYTFHS